MKKKISCLILAMLMSLQVGAAALAASPRYVDSVDTTALMQIAKNVEPGIGEITETTGDSVTVTKSALEAFPKFDYLCTLNMENVRNKFNFYYDSWESLSDFADIDDNRKNELAARLDEMRVTGEFTIEITYPKSMNVPAEFLTSGEMIGFDDNAKLIFGDDTRTLIEGDTENTIKIVVKVVGEDSEGRPGYVVAKNLKARIDQYLNDFTLSCENVGATQYGTFNVTGKMTGFTLAKEEAGDVFLKVDYQTNPEKATATCTVRQLSDGGIVIKQYKISFDVDGDKSVVSPITKNENTKLTVNELKVPQKEGYVFDGWYTDKELTNKVDEDIVVTDNMVLYGSWEVEEKLNDGDHFAYIIGYPEGDVRPNNFITREEIATIFFRLLKDEVRDELMAKTNEFTDVSSDRWSNTAISTMAKGGFIEGYADGTFGPDKFITRAEFTAIAARIQAQGDDVVHGFTDASGHWAEEYISDAFGEGWITGYTDNSFKPEQNITRAETMTIVNRMLNRFVNAEGIHEDAIVWVDNDKDAWYYYAVEEATNTHEYERQEGDVNETWTAILPNRDWLEFEN